MRIAPVVLGIAAQVGWLTMAGIPSGVPAIAVSTPRKAPQGPPIVRYGRNAASDGRRHAAQLLTECPLTGTLIVSKFRACDRPPMGNSTDIGFHPGTEGQS